MFNKYVDIFGSILTFIKRYMDYKDKQDENKFRTELNNDPASIWLSKFGGKDRRNKANSSTSNAKEYDNN